MITSPQCQKPDCGGVERGHPVRLSAKRELILNITGRLSVLRTLADRMSALQASSKIGLLVLERPSLTVGLLTHRFGRGN